MIANRENMRALADREGEPITARGVFSFCRACGAEYSASVGDYFMRADDRPLECCGEPMTDR